MSRRQKLIQIRVTNEENKNIESNARKLKMQVAPYIRMVAQNPTIIQNDYAAIREHTKQVNEIIKSINRLIFTIEATNNYLPKQIDSMVDYTKYILETENKLLDEVRKQWTKEYKRHRK